MSSSIHSVLVGQTWRAAGLVKREDGAPITANTVNYYLKALTGANAGNWYRNSDSSWQAGETANAMAHQADGLWSLNLTASPFVADVMYLEYAKESADLHVPGNGRLLRGQGVVDAVNVTQLAGSSLAAQVLAAQFYGYKDDAVVLVANGATDTVRGTNLATAYTAAKALTPGGAALSATNRVCVLIPPGRYLLTATLVLNGEFVDLAGLGSRPEGTEIYADINAATVRQTANDLRMRNFVIRGIYTGGASALRDLEINAVDNSASVYEDMHFRHQYGSGAYGTSDIGGTWQRCKADGRSWRVAANKDLAATMYDCEAGNSSFGGDADGAYISGRLVRCKAGDQSFGGCTLFGCDISGTLIDCEAGDLSFALGKEFRGIAIRCRGGISCFGATEVTIPPLPDWPGTFSGYAEDCVAGKGSFGGRRSGSGDNGKCTGTLVRCISRESELGMRLEGATLEGCLLTTATVDEHGVVLLDSLSRITNSTILVVEGGTGVPINAASALSVSAVGNRYNNRAAAVSGLGANVTNVGAGANLQTVKGIDADTALSARVDASATGTTVATNLDAKVSALPTASAIATVVWASGTRTLTSLGTAVADIVTAVWAATRRTLTGAGAGIGPTAGISTADIYGQVFRGGTRPLCARVYLATGIDITQAAISGITYSIFKLSRSDPDAREFIVGHVGVPVTIADVVFDTLQSDAIASNYNMKHVPDVSTENAFSEAGAEYLVQYRIQPTEGQVIIVRHRLACV